MQLTGINIRNFRSIGDDEVVLTPLRKCNILIGRNNVGKSNSLKAIQLILPILRKHYTNNITEREQQSFRQLERNDLHMQNSQAELKYILQFTADADQDQALVEKAGMNVFAFEISLKLPEKPELVNYSFTDLTDFRTAERLLPFISNSHFTARPPDYKLGEVFLPHIEAVFRRFFAQCLPEVIVIPEFRQIQEADIYKFNGAGLPTLLAELQHPEVGQDYYRQTFDSIERFMQQLLHLPEVRLEVAKNTIILTRHVNGQPLRIPLSAFGTGVHEMLIFITAVLSVNNTLCCIEEPEIHLHPTLQREFIDFLIAQPTNRYLISTHSHTFINAQSMLSEQTRDRIQVFHLQSSNGVTVGGPVITEEHSLTVLDDLGVKPSDLLQANCVVWVEGASDRIYLNHWLSLIDSNLKEGRDYSVMPYGGKDNLSHVSMDREDTADNLIELLRINQHAIVVIDSDKTGPSEELDETKKRIQEECVVTGNMCWITDGRAIENYLPARVVIEGTEDLTQKQISFNCGQFDKFDDIWRQALRAANARDLSFGKRKTKYARSFMKHFDLADMSSELQQQIQAIAVQINEWKLLN